MTIKPILFSGPMVRALLDGRETQTRRVLKNQLQWDLVGEAILRRFPSQQSGVPYAPGDMLWVRETWTDYWPAAPHYKATSTKFAQSRQVWKPSIHMPRKFSRLTLEVTDVRVERVQDISEEDAIAEGIELCPHRRPNFRCDLPQPNSLGVAAVDADKARSCFKRLWDSLNAKRGYSWESNPWVVALTVKVHRCNVDAMP